MATTPNDVADLLRRTVILKSTVQDVIFEWPNATRPTTSYATIGINSMTLVGFGEDIDRNDIDGDLLRNNITLFDISIGVSFFRPDSMFNASLFLGGLVHPDIIELWNSEGVGLVSRSNIRDITQIINSKFEDRTQMDIVMQALIKLPEQKILAADQFRLIGEIHNLGGKIDDVHIGPPFTP